MLCCVLSNSVRITIVIIEEILCCIIAPYIIYCYIRLNALSHSILVQKRHPKILKIAGICIFYWFAITLPTMCIAFAELDQFKGETQMIFDRLNTLFYPIGTIGCFLAIAWRFWHIFFDLKHASSQQNSAWKYHLDPSLVAHNFWLTHKKDYGSSAYTKKIVVIYYIVAVLITCTAYQCTIGTPYYVIVGHGVSTMLHNFIMTVIIILCWKIPPYRDYFFVREELRKVCFAMFGAMFFTVVAVTYGYFSSHVLTMMMANFGGTALFASIAAVSFVYYPSKIRRVELAQKMKLVAAHAVDAQSDEENKNNYSLNTILTHPKTYKLFMQHLAKEFSMECLLCFTEIVQFNFLMFERFQIINPEALKSTNINNTLSAFVLSKECSFRDSAPLSFINQQFEPDLAKYKLNDDSGRLMSEAKTVCLMLYAKYIQSGSELEVNVSYEVRGNLTNLLSDHVFWRTSNISPLELFCLYDAVATTMFGLMGDSFARFKQKDDFKYVIQALNQQLHIIP